jgi:hypothetical protein
MKNIIVKGITLILFSTLIIGFVAYRSGYFGGQKSSYSISPNGGALNNQTDTIPKTDSLKVLKMMSSSKSIILLDHLIQPKDSSKYKLQLDSVSRIKKIMYSSKSGIIFKSQDFKIDSIKTDSLKK